MSVHAMLGNLVPSSGLQLNLAAVEIGLAPTQT